MQVLLKHKLGLEISDLLYRPLKKRPNAAKEDELTWQHRKTLEAHLEVDHIVSAKGLFDSCLLPYPIDCRL